MTVEITDPTEGYFPDLDSDSWDVQAYTTETLDTLNGYICDLSTFNILLPNMVTNNGNGDFTLSFDPAGADPPVSEGDSLSIYVYCSQNPSDSDTVLAIASQDGEWGSQGTSKQRGKGKKLKAKQAPVCPLQIAAPTPIAFKTSQGVHDIPLTINQAANTPGLVLLLLHRYAGNHTQILRRYLRPIQAASTPTIQFNKVDIGFWDVINVVTIPIPDPAPTPAGFHDQHRIKPF